MELLTGEQSHAFRGVLDDGQAFAQVVKPFQSPLSVAGLDFVGSSIVPPDDEDVDEYNDDDDDDDENCKPG